MKIDSNWVVLDPELDSFQIADSISGIKDEETKGNEKIDENIDEIIVENVPSIPIIPTNPFKDMPDDLVEFLREEQEEQDRLLQQFLEEQYKCLSCGEKQTPETLLELQCEHNYCISCLNEYASKMIANQDVLDIICPHKQCAVDLPQWVLKVCFIKIIMTMIFTVFYFKF